MPNTRISLSTGIMMAQYSNFIINRNHDGPIFKFNYQQSQNDWKMGLRNHDGRMSEFHYQQSQNDWKMGLRNHDGRMLEVHYQQGSWWLNALISLSTKSEWLEDEDYEVMMTEIWNFITSENTGFLRKKEMKNKNPLGSREQNKKIKKWRRCEYHGMKLLRST